MSGTVEDILSDYDFDEVDAVGGLDFTELVMDIIQGNIYDKESGLITNIVNAVVDEVSRQKSALIQILIIAVLTAVFINAADSLKNEYVGSTGKMIAKIAIISLLTAVYGTTVKIAQEVLDAMVVFIKTLMPAYITVIAASSGSLTVAAFCESIMFVVMLISMLFSKIILFGGNLYILACTVSAVTERSNLSKLSALILDLMYKIMKAAVVLVVGMNLIRNMVLPLSDGIQAGLLTKAVALVPGIGNGVSAVSSTLIGAVTLIKNGVGVAALIVICIIAFVPMARIFVLSYVYQVAGALLEPVAGKNISDTITDFSKGMRLMLSVVMYAVIMLFVIIAILCVSTNINMYGA